MPTVITTSTTTALDVLKRAMRLLGVYAIGETPSADESATGLYALNALLDSYANGLLVYAKTTDAITLASGQASYTVGPSGATVSTRPVEVLDSSYIVYQDVSYGLSIWNKDDYNAISVKTVGGIPGGLFAQMDMPDITVTLWPVPSATMTLNLVSNKQVSNFPALNTVIGLPPGYDQALAFLLAETIAPEYEVPVPAQVAKEASRVRRVLKRTNVQVPRLKMPYGIPDNNTYVDWRA